jgi:two-component system, sensor histidine kinase and response regulator
VTRVLLVEDSLSQAVQLSALLEEAGFQVEQRNDAEAGFALLQKDHFDLVVSDLVLPGENGFELCRRIKRDPRLTHTPVIVLTTQADPANVLRGLEAGADGFMNQRHSPSEIVERVRRTLGIDGREDEATFQGRRFRLNVGKAQLLNVLLSAFEDGVELNRRLAQSEAALRGANQELLKTNGALAEANEVKDRFLGIAAHDLRNPLSAIQGFVAFLLDGTFGEVNEEQRDALQRIAKSVDSMLALLSDLLDVSALRSGKMTFHPERQSLAPMLTDAFDSVALAARQKGITLSREISDDLPIAEFDRQRLLAVVSNLLSNAVKFCSAGARVTLAARASSERVTISIQDDGPGIRADELPRLFEPFARLSARPTGGEKSTGLGLSIAKEIVESHGGTISAESIPGTRTTFVVELPLRFPKAPP